MGVYSIIDARADHSLFIVSNDFNVFSTVKERTYNKVELLPNKANLNELYTTYKIINKWMGRIYIFKIHGSFEHTYKEDVKIQLQYKGKFSKSAPSFTSNNETIASIFNNNKEIMRVCEGIDFEKLEIVYSARENKWSFEIWPNYGDFIWMLIPPMRYMRRPNVEEVKMTSEIIDKIRTTITKL